MKYNTDINSFGGIQDYHMLHEALRSYLNDEEDLKGRMIYDNIFGIRTEEGRGRFYRAINSSILNFVNEDHKKIYSSFFKNLDDRLPYNFLVFWQLAINNRLFNLITKQLYLKFYFDGKTSITREYVLAFIMHLKEEDEEFKQLNWTKKTILPIASKYLTILRKLGFVEGVQKKHLKHIQISDAVLAVFLNIIIAVYPEERNLLKSEHRIFSFISPDSFPERIKKIASKGWINMTYSGSVLNIEPTIDFKELADVIYNRT